MLLIARQVGHRVHFRQDKNSQPHFPGLYYSRTTATHSYYSCSEASTLRSLWFDQHMAKFTFVYQTSLVHLFAILSLRMIISLESMGTNSASGCHFAWSCGNLPRRLTNGHVHTQVPLTMVAPPPEMPLSNRLEHPSHHKTSFRRRDLDLRTPPTPEQLTQYFPRWFIIVRSVPIAPAGLLRWIQIQWAGCWCVRCAGGGTLRSLQYDSDIVAGTRAIACSVNRCPQHVRRV